MSRPLRLALVGLSSNAKTSWASAAHLPYLLSPRGQERYTIAALLNSSAAAAAQARADYHLPAEVKTYGDAAALAADPDIDVVAVCTRVDTHYAAALPAVQAGKAVFVEWPVAENAERAAELAAAARRSGARTVVGLQRRSLPVVRAIRAFLASGAMGKVLSSEVQTASPFGDRDTMSEGLAYFLDRKVGGNLATIMVGHMIDYIHYTLGEYTTSNVHSQIQRPEQTVLSTPPRIVTSTTPDLISIHGTLTPSAHVAAGASLLVSFRRGAGFPGTDVYTWRIHGEKGELLVRAPRVSLEPGAGEAEVVVQWVEFATGEVRDVEVRPWEAWARELPTPARAIGFVYDVFFEGREAEFGLLDFEGAVGRHRQTDEMVDAVGGQKA